jgi:hypothetical protein
VKPDAGEPPQLAPELALELALHLGGHPVVEHRVAVVHRPAGAAVAEAVGLLDVLAEVLHEAVGAEAHEQLEALLPPRPRARVGEVQRVRVDAGHLVLGRPALGVLDGQAVVADELEVARGLAVELVVGDVGAHVEDRLDPHRVQPVDDLLGALGAQEVPALERVAAHGRAAALDLGEVASILAITDSAVSFGSATWMARQRIAPCDHAGGRRWRPLISEMPRTPSAAVRPGTTVKSSDAAEACTCHASGRSLAIRQRVSSALCSTKP